MYRTTLLITAAFFGILLVVMPDAASVVAPILVMSGTAWVFFSICRDPLELGGIFAGVVLLYAVLPLLTYLMRGMVFNQNNDSRLYFGQPTPQEMGLIGWFYATFLICFAAGYIFARRKVEASESPSLPRIDAPTKHAIIVISLILIVFLWGVGLFFDLSASSYLESYLVSERLPLLIRQVVSTASFAKFYFSILILIVLFCGRKSKRNLIVVFLWLSVSGMTTFFYLWSRTETLLLCLMTLMIYHNGVKRIRARYVMVACICLLGAALLFGALRSGTTDSLATNEFESIWANAFELSRREAVYPDKWALYLSDFVNIVPQQISPISKTTASRWYLETYHRGYSEQGGGLAFGAIPESIVGLGLFDLVWRGLALGLIFGAIYRYFARHRQELWPFAVYVWFSVMCYGSLRNTTFALIVPFTLQVVPGYLALKILAAGFRGNRIDQAVESSTKFWRRPRSV